MIINERDSRHGQVLAAARQIMTAARTAPKAKGVDIIEIALVEGDDLRYLSEKMIAMVEEHGMKFFLRDADNLNQAECVILIGTHSLTHGLNCAHCGYSNCGDKLTICFICFISKCIKHYIRKNFRTRICRTLFTGNLYDFSSVFCKCD